MGWVKTEVEKTSEIFSKIIATFGEKWNGRIGDSTTPYEYFSDYIRDYYDVTLKQCDEVCKMIKKYYNIKRFYYTEMKKLD